MIVINFKGVYDRRHGGKPSKPNYCQHKSIKDDISANNNDISADINAQTKQNHVRKGKEVNGIVKIFNSTK